MASKTATRTATSPTTPAKNNVSLPSIPKGDTRIEFTIPKGATPVGFAVTTSINAGYATLRQSAKVTVGGVVVINWEGHSPQATITQVAQHSQDRSVDRLCVVEIQNNINKGIWQPSSTKYAKLTSGATEDAQAYVLHAVYSDTDNPPSNTSDFDDCVVHVMYHAGNMVTPVSTPMSNSPLLAKLTPLLDALKNGSDTEKELIEKSEGSAFAPTEITATAVNCAKSAPERAKSIIMFAAGKIIMHNPAVASVVANDLNLVTDLLKTTNTNLLSTAVETLWMLAFHPQCSELVKNPLVIARLKQLEATTSDPPLKKNISGLLFQLGLRPTRPVQCSNHCSIHCSAHCVSATANITPTPQTPQQTSSTPTTQPAPVPEAPKKGGTIMLSYNWGSQEMVKKIKAALTASGYNVWIDIERMQGSTLEAMALAVEQADLMLVCASKKYKESAACRTEGEYAYNLRKPIIPLMMENDYRPDGWLGALLGTKLYHSFFSQDQQEFYDALSPLLREIGDRGKY